MTLPPRLRQHPLFRFFASLHLALTLLAVLIIASIVGTIYESRLTAEVARAYIYEAWWFDIWLLLLCLNLATVAFSRLPWKKAHTGFLLTHLGIILLLIGAYVGKTFGIEGSITLFENQAPVSRLLINQKELRVALNQEPIASLPVDIIHRLPSPEKPRHLGRWQDWRIDAIGYSDHLEAVFQAQPASAPNPPALRFELETKLMGQKLGQWLLADDDDHAVWDLGLARIRLFAGEAPALDPKTSQTKTSKPTKTSSTTPKPGAGSPVTENIFSFAKLPGQQVGKILQGSSTGLKVDFVLENKRIKLLIVGPDRKWELFIDPANPAERSQSLPLPGTQLKLRLLDYWPDFQLQNNQPTSLSDQPNNPAILARNLRAPAQPCPRHPHCPERPTQLQPGKRQPQPTRSLRQPPGHPQLPPPLPQRRQQPWSIATRPGTPHRLGRLDLPRSRNPAPCRVPHHLRPRLRPPPPTLRRPAPHRRRPHPSQPSLPKGTHRRMDSSRLDHLLTLQPGLLPI
ncbi:MAG: cytochrome c biogenesis protein ResB [Blastochloris sp.]|nr:cytochrome c biogenesis protein ResB [Blastochloris sp.]